MKLLNVIDHLQKLLRARHFCIQCLFIITICGFLSGVFEYLCSPTRLPINLVSPEFFWNWTPLIGVVDV